MSSRMRGGEGEVLRSAYLKKLKTSKRKFFVLKAETAESSARLEYWDTEKKYNSGIPPKRSIVLKSCFNINKRNDTKYKHVVALYTKDDCFCVVLETEEDADSWLKIMLSLQQGREEIVDGAAPRPTFEHVWDVNILNRGLGKEGFTGNYRLCLTDNTLNIIKVNNDDVNKKNIQLNLNNIRSCGNLKDFFFLELGRSSCLGAGELWMQTEDNNIAHNVHSTIFHAMASNKDELVPKSRNRSSSATESSKPSSVGTRKHQNHTGMTPKSYILSQDVSQTTECHVPTNSSSTSSQHPIVSGVASFYQHLIHRGASKASERRHSISAGGGVSSSGLISHQRTQSLPLANPAPISDQNTTTTTTISSHPLRATAKRSNQSSKYGPRERCDSMPSRARTTSEGNHIVQLWNQTRFHLLPHRPSSLYNRDISHSPPSGSPVSPPSAPCSTDSAGSSYSLADDQDPDHDLNPLRYSHSLTPEEAIAEEDYENQSLNSPNYMPMQPKTDDGYVDMSPRGVARNHTNQSPSVSLSSVTSGTPSTDLRFSEYPLEKVSSYFSEEGDDSRPARAYSVGSRQDCCVPKNDNLRVRAMSVGSKAKKIPSRILQHHHYITHVNNKSSSAPILSSNNPSSRQHSYNSIGPMDDLMEMDFSSSNSRSNSGYMQMTPKTSGYVEMKPAVASGNDYMDMDGKRKNNNNNYMDMNYKKTNETTSEIDTNNYQLSPAKTSFLIGSPSGVFAQNRHEAKTPEGYVEMSIGKGHHQRQSSLDSAQIVVCQTNDDYAVMSLGGNNNNRRTNKKKDKAATRSQPIAIQNPQKNPSVAATSSSPMYSVFGRKFSTGTPPLNMHLPLGDSRVKSRRDSRDSSSSSINTPSSSSTIFPLSLNSPCSPVKADTPIKVPPAVLNTVYKKPQKKKTDNNDYTPMDFDSKPVIKHNNTDYVNYNPCNSDYALMKPPASSSFRPIVENKEESASRTRPSSTSSEVCSSSGSTVVGSRPESVNSDRIRPNSVDVQLHYASLDLDDGNRSPRTVKNQSSESGGSSEQMNYAAIDFVKSEGLKQSFNAKVKH